ncbi:hypothetical protein V3851_01925 [Paenibacillus sp. M1]|uniref:Lipoprotein n=1 Tax=Paenibacillus haidiansis TaxID=1574488 RepID=A0ABU7VMA1_9BACL
MQKSNFKAGVALCLILILSACGFGDARTPEQWFNVTWSGLAGSDHLAFRGQAAIMRGENSKVEESVNFTGELQDHHQLALQTVLPSGESGENTGAVAAVSGPKTAYTAELQWQGGTWNLKSNENDAFTRGIARLNPLDQLEDMRTVKKTIRAEAGAPRGLKILRIELDPEEAKRRLKERLTEDMEAVKAGWQEKLVQVASDRRTKVESELESEWETGRNQLEAMLEQAKVKAVYHLTINRKTGLPVRLSSQTDLDYISGRGIREHEVMVTDSRFGSSG